MAIVLKLKTVVTHEEAKERLCVRSRLIESCDMMGVSEVLVWSERDRGKPLVYTRRRPHTRAPGLDIISRSSTLMN